MWFSLLPEAVRASERFDWFNDTVSQAVMPTVMSVEPFTEFRAEAAMLDLGAPRVARFAFSPLRSRRTPALIRRGDPEQYQLALIRGGAAVLSQEGNESRIGAGEFVFWDTSRPSDTRILPGPGPVRLTMLQFPRAALSLPGRRLERLLAARLPGGRGVAAVLASFLDGLEAHGDTCGAAELSRLGTVAVELAGALLAQQADGVGRLPAEIRARVLLDRVRAFIEDNLGDPQLTPGVVAARHNISLRTLHQLFRTQEVQTDTVHAWIRRRRLERCREDLASTRLHTYPVQVIADRWGFSSATVFSRTFRRAYGVTPTEYRGMSLVGTLAPKVEDPRTDGTSAWVPAS
ncbi:helix-turn-helix domain-containing protein [Kitasatospora sp. NPDC056327]|uniref:AraC-like ligand-binding domain-containing protein n=1 Tax=Kitasatospora sp. NPDC056327 TaxID=3345785 RepID=UPI0035E02361